MGSLITMAAPKLSKLIPLLGSDKAGEVVAAASAIGRALKASGADWHDLAKWVSSPPTIPTRHQRPADDWQEMARFCWRHAHRLNQRERDFVEDMTAWSDEPSDKQLAWLKAIHVKVGGRA